MRQKNYWSYFAFSQIQLVETKMLPAVLLPQEAKKHNLLAFPKFNKEVSHKHRRQSTVGVYLPLGEYDCLGWSSDKGDTLGLA